MLKGSDGCFLVTGDKGMKNTECWLGHPCRASEWVQGWDGGESMSYLWTSLQRRGKQRSMGAGRGHPHRRALLLRCECGLSYWESKKFSVQSGLPGQKRLEIMRCIHRRGPYVNEGLRENLIFNLGKTKDGVIQVHWEKKVIKAEKLSWVQWGMHQGRKMANASPPGTARNLARICF